MASQKLNELVFKHMIELPNSQCVFCSAAEKASGKTLLFLVFALQNRIYQRNGMKETWDEVATNESDSIRQQFDDVIRARKVPVYSTKPVKRRLKF